MEEAMHVREINPLTNADIEMRREIDHANPVYWTDKRLKQVTRFRLLTDAGFPQMDVSYCYGVLRDGTPVRVSLPFGDLPKVGWKRALVEWGKREGVYVHGLGMIQNVSILY
jgi:hypothetical protein